MARDIIGPRVESVTVIMLNGKAVKITFKLFVFLSTDL